MAVWLHIQFFVPKSHSFRSLQILKNSILEFTEKYGLMEISSLLFFLREFGIFFSTEEKSLNVSLKFKHFPHGCLNELLTELQIFS